MCKCKQQRAPEIQWTTLGNILSLPGLSGDSQLMIGEVTMETINAFCFFHTISSAYGPCPNFKLAETFGNIMSITSGWIKRVFPPLFTF